MDIPDLLNTDICSPKSLYRNRKKGKGSTCYKTQYRVLRDIMVANIEWSGVITCLLCAITSCVVNSLPRQKSDSTGWIPIARILAKYNMP